MQRFLLATLLCATLACTPAAKPAPVAPPPPPPKPAAIVAVAQLDPLSPEVVLDELHALDGEVSQASQLARGSAHQTKVKKLAAHVLSTRKTAEAEVAAVAAKLSVNLKDPGQLALPADSKAAMTAQRDAFNSLSGKKGKDFDAAYLTSLDVALKDEMGLLSQIDAKAANPDLKTMSAKLSPAVTEHEKSASLDLKSIGQGKG